ncbi:sulfotransferase family 2 domain-containing protein [Antarctobacter heliothermus]|uniref:Sulfotransferase family protein n=1 Tax=Antarctobacter heliothermus TaxID=74033 RepID=A0A239JMY8_9RHOB|nr:sulfotransferase family 2 domain-containing protein [Antarctobacter heliothermus]SNT07170.1 Sulfotransferase family protein [Antarctobacter heliothermus]
MILSHRNRFIFLHCRKTAGSSISVALSRYLGPEDLQLSGLKETFEAGIPFPDRVYTEAGQVPDRKIRTRIEDRMHLSGALGAPRRAERARKRIHRLYRGLLGAYPYHARATAIAAAFPEAWASYTKFCVVRNPWDRVVSDYFWRTRNVETPPTFDAFVKAIRDGETLGGIVAGEPDNWPLYTIDDQIAVDKIIRFESLHSDLQTVLGQLGRDWDGWLPRAKARGARQKSAPKRTGIYTPELQQIVGDLFEKEVTAFGYVPPAD